MLKNKSKFDKIKIKIKCSTSLVDKNETFIRIFFLLRRKLIRYFLMFSYVYFLLVPSNKRTF